MATQPTADRRPLMSPQAVVKDLGLDQFGMKHPKKLILKMARRGDLVGIKVGRRVMIDPASVDKFRRGE